MPRRAFRGSERDLFFLFERVAGAAKLDERVGVVGTGAPIAARFDEFFFGNEKPAVAALELFVLNLVVASFPK
jgi:hypothetical protein